MATKARRKKGTEHISSVEELHDYLQVTSPRLWVFLGVIMVAIVVSITYASTITLINEAHTTAQVTEAGEGEASYMVTTIDVPEEAEEIVAVGMPVKIELSRGTIKSIDYDPEDGTWATVQMDGGSAILAEGTYDATITLEKATPLSYLFN
jgi:hypothetical protein